MFSANVIANHVRRPVVHNQRPRQDAHCIGLPGAVRAEQPEAPDGNHGIASVECRHHWTDSLVLIDRVFLVAHKFRPAR